MRYITPIYTEHGGTLVCLDGKIDGKGESYDSRGN